MMKLKSHHFFCIAAVALFSFTGCLNLKTGYPAKNSFLLDAKRTDKKGDEKGAVIQIQKFRISPRFKGKGFVYRFEKLKFESDFYSEFFISPDDMITEQVQQWLSKSDAFMLVTARNSEPPPDSVLQGRITELYGDFRNGGTPKAVMELKFLLLSAKQSPAQVLFKKRYRADVPIKEKTSSLLAAGWNQALETILRQLEQDLKSVPMKSSSLPAKYNKKRSQK